MTAAADQARTLREQAAAGSARTRVITVASGKGGVGKSSVATGLAVVAAKAGRRVVLIDGDAGLGNADLLLGLRPAWTLRHVLDGEVSLEQALAPGPAGVRVLAAGTGLQWLTRLDETHKESLRTVLLQLSESGTADLVVIDAAAGIGDNVLFFVGAAQETLLVVTPEPGAIADGYALIKAASAASGVRRFSLVVNGVTGAEAAHEAAARLLFVTRRFLLAQVELVGHVPEDGNVRRAVLKRTSVVELFPEAPASRSFKRLYATLVRRWESPDGGQVLDAP